MVLYYIDQKTPSLVLSGRHPREGGDPDISWIPAYTGVTITEVNLGAFLNKVRVN